MLTMSMWVSSRFSTFLSTPINMLGVNTLTGQRRADSWVGIGQDEIREKVRGIMNKTFNI